MIRNIREKGGERRLVKVIRGRGILSVKALRGEVEEEVVEEVVEGGANYDMQGGEWGQGNVRGIGVGNYGKDRFEQLN